VSYDEPQAFLAWLDECRESFVDFRMVYNVLMDYSCSLLEHAFLDHCRYSLWILTRHFDGIFDLDAWLNYSGDRVFGKLSDE
jgi:hypothetical protein